MAKILLIGTYLLLLELFYPKSSKSEGIVLVRIKEKYPKEPFEKS